MAPKNRLAKKTPTDEVLGKGGVLYTLPNGEGGPINIKVDFSLVPAPQNYYYADALALAEDHELRMVVLSCGRRDRKTEKFADQIDIVMPSISLNQFWSSSRGVEKTVDQLLQSMQVKHVVRPIASEDPISGTLFANMIFIAVGAGDTCIDFYHLPSRDVHLAKTRKMDMQILPTVRVIMSVVLTKYFFELFRPYANDEGTNLMHGKTGVKNVSLGR
jgi:hypothetical protein